MALVFSVAVSVKVYWASQDWTALLHAGFPLVGFFYTMAIHTAISEDTIVQHPLELEEMQARLAEQTEATAMAREEQEKAQAREATANSKATDLQQKLVQALSRLEEIGDKLTNLEERAIAAENDAAYWRGVASEGDQTNATLEEQLQQARTSQALQEGKIPPAKLGAPTTQLSGGVATPLSLPRNERVAVQHHHTGVGLKISGNTALQLKTVRPPAQNVAVDRLENSKSNPQAKGVAAEPLVKLSVVKQSASVIIYKLLDSSKGQLSNAQIHEQLAKQGVSVKDGTIRSCRNRWLREWNKPG